MCIKGQYGSSCEFACPAPCIDCVSNDKCTECSYGRYGSACQLYCSIGCKDIICDQTSGQCTHGCTTGFYLSGDSCVSCPDHCIACNNGSYCTDCSAGFYGRTCELSCHEGCMDQLCFIDSGNCSHGCSEDYQYQQGYCIKGKAKIFLLVVLLEFFPDLGSGGGTGKKKKKKSSETDQFQLTGHFKSFFFLFSTLFLISPEKTVKLVNSLY